MSKFSNEIKRMRIKKNMTQSDLGAILGCSNSAISAMEHDRSPMQRMETILAYCRALEMDEDKWLSYFGYIKSKNGNYNENETFNPNQDSIYYFGKKIELKRLTLEELAILNIILSKY